MSGVEVYLLFLAGVFVVPVAIGVTVTRLRLTGAQVMLGVVVLVVMGVGVVAWGINSAMHPSAAGLGRTITTAPVPSAATLISEDIRDGDIEEQPQASMSYALPGGPDQECVAVVQTYLDAGYRIASANTLTGPTKPVRSAATLCANGFVQPDLNTAYPYLDMSVCTGAGTAQKCFRATLEQRTAQDRAREGVGAPAGNSVLFLQA